MLSQQNPCIYALLLCSLIIVCVDFNTANVLTFSSSHNSSFYRYEVYDSDGKALVAGMLENNETSKANLTAITWAHAVNSQQELNDVLNSATEMIEADIVLGQVVNRTRTDADIPVMAHPPANVSDISLAEFLDRINRHNLANADSMKGVKLDFKTIEVFEGALDILDEMIPQMNYPIWLNADIVSGPVNQTSMPVDPQRFFAGCARFDKAVLSIGWTTHWGANYTDESYAYMPNQIDDMLSAIKGGNVTQPITFPVRAGIAANSQNQLHQLVRAVNETNESSITIWSSENDYVNVEKLRSLIFSFGFDRVYLDVPDSLSSRLDLGRENGGSTVRPKLSVLNISFVASVCVVLVNLFQRRGRL